MAEPTPEAQQERQAVVNYLRKEAVELEKGQTNCDKWTAEWMSYREQIESALEFADAIERGEHAGDAE